MFRNLLLFSVVFSNFAHAVTLEEAFRSAFRKNEVVEEGKSKVVQADARYGQLRGAIYPNLGLNATYFLQPKLADPIARDIFPNQQTTVNLTLTQPIFRGLREFAALSQQKSMLAASEDSYRARVLQLYQNVSQSYFTVLNLEQDLKNLNQQAGIYGKRVAELQTRVKRGESSSSEALTSQSAEVSTLSEIQQTEASLVMERENFAFLTGLSESETLTDPQLLKPSKKSPLEKLDAYLAGIDSRPDVLEATKLLKAAEESVSIARGAHFPSIDLVGNYYFLRPPGFLKEINWDVQLKLTFPIFEGGATQSKVTEASAQQKDAELRLHRTKRMATQEIRSIYQSLKTKLDQLEILNRSLDIANRNSETLQKEYRRGLSRNIDVQVALADFRVAKRAVDQAHFSTQYEWIRLQAASSKLSLPSQE